LNLARADPLYRYPGAGSGSSTPQHPSIPNQYDLIVVVHPLHDLYWFDEPRHLLAELLDWRREREL
jgi:hypothetical protein